MGGLFFGRYVFNILYLESFSPPFYFLLSKRRETSGFVRAGESGSVDIPAFDRPLFNRDVII